MVKPIANKISRLVKRQAEAIIPTVWGNFKMIAYAHRSDEWMPHLALIHEKTEMKNGILTRIHSECLTGDLFGSRRCDCGEQLFKSLEMIAEKGGVLLYLRQEGRGIGIINKLKAYNLQDKGLNTIDANLHLGLEVDARHYDIAIQMLRDLGVKQLCLLTNNPEKISALENSEITVIRRVPLIIEPQDENIDYLRTKQRDMGHLFNL
jgi:3,4-dihydroxy 2-butanone 4-phosphate synthase/GTP cyclohydrolase II